VERYFHFYGYPSPDLRGSGGDAGAESTPGPEMPDLPADATPLMKAAHAAQATAAAQDPLSVALLQRRRQEWVDTVVALKDTKLQNMIAEGRLKLRKGAVQFLDECLLEDGVQVVIIGATASSPEEGVLQAVLKAIGPLRAAAISVSSGNESIDGSQMKQFEGFTSVAGDARSDGGFPLDGDRQVSGTQPMGGGGSVEGDSLDGFGEHVGLHDAAWEEARKAMQMAMRVEHKPQTLNFDSLSLP